MEGVNEMRDSLTCQWCIIASLTYESLWFSAPAAAAAAADAPAEKKEEKKKEESENESDDDMGFGKHSITDVTYTKGIFNFIITCNTSLVHVHTNQLCYSVDCQELLICHAFTLDKAKV